MAGLAAKYIVGVSGGYLGSDGYLGKDLEIYVYQSDRMWIEATYKTYTYGPISMSLNVVVPPLLEEKEMLRYALILYASDLFKDCDSFLTVKKECDGVERIDFEHKETIPEHFYKLLEESKSINIEEKVSLFRCVYEEISI